MPPIVSTDWRRCIFPPNQLFLYFTTTKVIEKASNYKVLFNNVCRLAAAPLNCCKLRATRLASGKCHVHTPNKEFDDFPMKFEDVSEIPTINRAEWIDYLEKRAAEGYEIKYSTNCDNEPEIIIAVKNIGQPVFAE